MKLTQIFLNIHRFLLEDLTQKVESIFGVRKFGNSDTCQNIAYPVEFISDVVNVLPRILKHFKEVADQLQQFINNKSASTDTENESESEESNEGLFGDEANLIKVCFGLCIRLLAALFTWPDYSDDANKEILNGKLFEKFVGKPV